MDDISSPSTAVPVTHRTVVGGFGDSVQLHVGERVQIVNTLGRQVVDTWALSWPEGLRHLSMSHTRLAVGRIRPQVGDVLVDDNRQPMLRMIEDTSGGEHDTLVPACDAERYRSLGFSGYHASCADNYSSAVVASGAPAPSATPDPLNLFMAVPVSDAGAMTLEPSKAPVGSRVVLEALQDVLLVVSACPQDMVPINGDHSGPRSVDIYVEPTHANDDDK